MYSKHIKTSKYNLCKNFTASILFLAFTITIAGFPTSQSRAACTLCRTELAVADSYIWQQAEDNFDTKIDQEFKRLQRFIVHEMWEQSILPGMMLAAEQFTAVALHQAMIIGMFIDAESQMDAQRLLQEIRARAHKDYHPSVGLCEFGSVMKSLAATERQGEVSAVVLSQRSQDRQLGQRDTAGMYGSNLEKSARIMHFKSLFCNEKDRGNTLTSALSSLCSTNVAWGEANFDEAARSRMNKDIDYFSLIDSPWTLTLNLFNKNIVDAGATPEIHNEDDEHVLAMASNLYAHDNFPRIPARLLTNHPNKELTSMQRAYMDMRSIIAKRSVAENSFYAIAAMKAEGNKTATTSGGSTSADDTSSSRIYMEHILNELGVPTSDILALLGEYPSYYAQMEILTKKIYQNPDFYTNLYDKPANVERKTVALQAIKLMQKFDILKSFLRNEMSTSILLELAVSDLQNEVEDRIRIIKMGNK